MHSNNIHNNANANIIAPQQIILASTSKIRCEMLNSLRIPFSVIAPIFNEDAEKDAITKLPPSKQASFLAKGKGQSISEKFPDAIVISADQICELDGQIFNKPLTAENAIATLEMLAGKTHTQYNATCIFAKGKLIKQIERQAYLTMRDLQKEEITAYVAIDCPLNACGAYKYESLGKHLFAEIDGCEETIQGFSVQEVLSFLYKQHYLKMQYCKQPVA